jgi:hypothetical protein
MNRGRTRQTASRDLPIELTMVQWLGLTASVLGMLAGIFEIAVGTSQWAGNKNDPTVLGIATIGLGVIVGLAALLSVRTHWADGVLAIGSIMVLAAIVGLTTAGWAWAPAALCALLAGGIALGRVQRAGSLLRTLQQSWPVALLAVLAVIELAFAAISRSAVGLLGLMGSVSIAAAVALRDRTRRWAVVVLVAGTLPFALATLWTVVVPVTTVLALAIGLPFVVRHTDEQANAQ